VLVRRLEADFADPLELNAASRLGVPGLVQAVRDGTVVIANRLWRRGSSRALLAPAALAPACWPRSPAAQRRDLVLARKRAQRRYRPARRIDRRRPISASCRPWRQPARSRASLDPAERKRNPRLIAHAASIRRQGGGLAATTPVWRDGGSAAPFTLRLSGAATPTLARDAGASCASPTTSRRARQPAARRQHRRCLGAVRQAGEETTLLRRPTTSPSRARPDPAEPHRGQPGWSPAM